MTDTAVLGVELDRERELRVRFDDGVTCTFPLTELREVCPCATCRTRRERSEPVFTTSPVTARDATLHGNWGIAIDWSDGHSTGIYPWTHLRAWWDEIAETGVDR